MGILLEEFGKLQLDGTDSDSSNAGSYLAAEEDTNVRFITEESGIILTEGTSTNSFDDYKDLSLSLTKHLYSNRILISVHLYIPHTK